MGDWRMAFEDVIARLGEVGADDIQWSENAGPPKNPDDFAAEAIYVICNSGMKHTIARRIYDNAMKCLLNGWAVSAMFNHKGKCDAIEKIWREREALYAEYTGVSDADRVEWLGRLPFIGNITKYHLAKNFGVDCVKPDVHLARLADILETTPDALCAEIAARTGYKKRTIDVLIWRACATGVINSRTAQLEGAPAHE